MLRTQDFRDDISPEALARHLQAFGLNLAALEGRSTQDLPLAYASLIGMRTEHMRSYPETAREAIRACGSHELLRDGLAALLQPLDSLLSQFEALLDRDALAQLEAALPEATRHAYRSTLLNSCFMQFLVRSQAQAAEGNMALQLIAWLLDYSARAEGKTFIWIYTREELEQVVSMVMVQQGGKQQPGFAVTDTMKAQLLEEQAALDPVIAYLQPLMHISEKQLRKDLHAWLQQLVVAVNRLQHPGFAHPRSYYLGQQSGRWKPVWSNTYAILAPYFQWPADLEAYAQEPNPAATTREFDDYRKKKIQRLFAPGSSKSGQKT